MTRPTPLRARLAVVPLTLGLALGVAGCTSDDPGSADPQQSRAGTTFGADAAPPLATTASVGEVTGRLERARRARVKQRVTEVVDRWLDRAYVGGSFPRNDFRKAFTGFTAGAAAEARRDLALMSNKPIGRKVEAVRATNRRLRIDVLAARGRAVGVTARVVLDFETSGRVSRSERVAGRLYLTWRDGWKVFAYDLTRGVHQPQKQQQQQKQQNEKKQKQQQQNRKAA